MLPAIYGVLFFAALIVMFSTADQTALCGIYVVLLTFPWSLLAPLICSVIWPGMLQNCGELLRGKSYRKPMFCLTE